MYSTYTRRACFRMLLVIAASSLIAAPAAGRTLTAVDLRVSGDPGAAALSFVRANADRFGGDPAAAHTLRVERTTRVPHGVAVRVAQRVGGLRVVDAGVHVLVLAGRLVSASGELALLEPSSRLPVIDRDGAAAALRAALPTARIRRAELAWLRRDGAAARRVWSLDALTPSPLNTLEAWVDVDSGRLLGWRPTLRRVEGKAYGTNPVMSQVEVVQLLGLQGDGQQLVGEHADVSSCKVTWGPSDSADCKRHAVPDTDGDFLLEPDEPSFADGFAEVQAYHHVDKVHRWFAEQFGFVRPGTSQQIGVMVNTSFEGRDGDEHGLYNAMFADMNGDGRGELIFGQGDRDFAYDADVIYHEFTHSVVDALSKLDPGVDTLGLNLAPLAINEGFADTFAAILSGDPAIGEYAGGAAAIRTLSSTASCPDDLIGESHTDGLLWGGTAWAIYSKLSATEQTTFAKVLYETLAGLGPSPFFSDVAAVLLKVTQTVAPALETAVDAELTARNLLDCPRMIPLSPIAPREVYLLGGYSLGSGFAPAAYQYVVDVPEDAVSLTLDIRYKYQLRGESPVGIFIRKDEPVGFGAQVVHDLAMPNPEQTFTLQEGDAQKPLEPGATYYLLPVNVARWGANFVLSVNIVQRPPPDPDAGVDTAEPDGGADAGVADAAAEDAGEQEEPPTASGCSCQVSAGSSATGLSLLGLLLLSLLARRRR